MKKVLAAVLVGLILAGALLWVGLSGVWKKPAQPGAADPSGSVSAPSASGAPSASQSGGSDAGAEPGAAEQPEQPLLGVWAASVFNLDFPASPDMSGAQLRAQLDEIIENTKKWGLNALFLQVHPCADALYESELFPVSAFLSSSGELPDGFDPLAYAVEKAHAEGIELHAWINPLRVTAGTADAPQHDPQALPQNSPARLHPEYTVAYDDGKLYFDAGYPQVRRMVADCVMEIVENYDVDGVHFDDYFYPYPVSGGNFDDSASFAQYGDGRTLEDFRRDNITDIIRTVHDEIKAAKPQVAFGVSPFAVWRNDSESALGSPTRAGVQSYSDLYADTRLWVKQGMLDYIAPQIYWTMEQPGVEFPVVYNWWSEQVAGTDVKLVTGHAAYKVGSEEYGWDEAGELSDQVACAMRGDSFGGCIFYRYASLAADPENTAVPLLSLFEAQGDPDEEAAAAPPNLSTLTVDGEYAQPVLISPQDGPKVLFSTSNNGYTTASSRGSVIGGANPALPLYCNGARVNMTEKGFFSLFRSLEVGANVFTFRQGEEEFTYTVIRTAPAQPSDEPPAPAYDAWPDSDCWYGAGQTVTLSVKAPAGSEVTAVHMASEYELQAEEGDGQRLTYTCRVTLDGSGKSRVVYRIKSPDGEQTAQSEGALSVYDSDRRVFLRVASPDSVIRHTRIVYARFDVPVPQGVVLEAVGFKDGYYELKDFGLISQDLVEPANETPEESFIRTAGFEENESETRLLIRKTGSRAVDVRCYPNSVLVTAYGRSLTLLPALADSADGAVTVRRFADRVEYLLGFDGERGFAGYTIEAAEDGVTVTFPKPVRIGGGSSGRVLEGRKIALNAGHGLHSGAPGPLGIDGWVEDDFNQDIVNRARDYLTALGASVTTISDYEAPKEIDEVVQEYESDRYDVAVSVHFNSVAESSDPSACSGTCAYYSYPNAQRLAQILADGVCVAADMPNNGAIRDSFYVTRTYVCPSVLMEMGYMCNPAEYDRLCDESTRDAIARGLVEGILQYLQQ